MGYHSTLTYNKKGLVLYLTYQYLQSISKLVFLGIYIASLVSPEFNQSLPRNQILLLYPTTANIIIFSLTTSVQIYITYFVQRFYNLLSGPQILLTRSNYI